MLQSGTVHGLSGAGILSREGSGALRIRRFNEA